ncbi:MAG: hypothetical protein JJU13_16860 [Balneolaceae bacterium]|nr:hypothetical protein [Balneolaceae bacterium]
MSIEMRKFLIQFYLGQWIKKARHSFLDVNVVQLINKNVQNCGFARNQKIEKTMKNQRKKVIVFFAACMFAMMMIMNVNTTINGTNFSVAGYTAVVSGSTGVYYYYATTETCWNTGFEIYICRFGIGNCCIPCQAHC